MRLLDYEFTEKKVSPWGGMRMVHELYERCGLKQLISDLPFKEPGSNRGYDPRDLIEGFMMSVILGAHRLSHTNILRGDPILGEVFDWQKGIASQSTYSRFFSKYDLEDNNAIFPRLQREWFSQIDLDKMTIDIDSTILPRYGTQEGVEKGYNPNKKGRGSHHPIMAFAAELKMVINAWMRTGNGASSTDFDAFFEEMLEIIPVEKIGLIRADAGFYGKKIFQLLENQKLSYIIPAHFKPGLQTRVMEQQSWLPIDKGAKTTMDYCSFTCQAKGWDQARRFVVIRKDIEDNPSTGGKLLFPEVEAFESYKYVAFVTNLELSAVEIWRLYNQRAEAESRIKELKYDYGIEGFCMKDFAATENAFRWVMVTHNLMSLFRILLLKNRKHVPRLSTINFQCIAIGSYLSKSERKQVLKLSLKDKRRKFVEGLFQKFVGVCPHFQISIE